MSPQNPLAPAGASAPMPQDRFLGRQPVVDADSSLFGYELFFRAGEADAFSGDPELATREVVDHWLMLVPTQDPCAVFVNCTRSSLVDNLVTLLPASSTVLEIPSDLEPDPELLRTCVGLRNQGYRIALDRFVPGDRRMSLLEMADFIKIDFPAMDFQSRHAIYAAAPSSTITRIAQTIETEYQMRIALAEGNSLFQGYFFSHPMLISTRSIPQNQFIYIQLMAALNEAPIHLRKIEKLISGEPSLCYRLLRIANSAAQGHAGTVSSVHEALLMVGEDATRRMVIVAMAGALATHRSPALLSMALARARFGELLAPAVAQDPAKLFLLGILSLLDVLLGASMESVLRSLPVSGEMKQALLGDNSPCGAVLELVCSLESCDWQRCDRMQYLLGLPEGSIAPLYVEALQWASSMLAA